MVEARPEVQRTIAHLFKDHPFGKDICDALMVENGRRRTCTRPRAEHFEEGQLEAELGRLHRLVEQLQAEPTKLDLAVAIVAADYLFAHSVLSAVGTGPERPEAARRLADAWLALTTANRARRDAQPSITTEEKN